MSEHDLLVGDKVTVVRKGQTYSSYIEWVVENGKNYLGYFQYGNSPDNGLSGVIVCMGLHSNECKVMLYGVMIGDRLFVLSKDGLEFCSDYEVELL